VTWLKEERVRWSLWRNIGVCASGAQPTSSTDPDYPPGLLLGLRTRGGLSRQFRYRTAVLCC
jgi:hypothetical protein